MGNIQSRWPRWSAIVLAIGVFVLAHLAGFDTTSAATLDAGNAGLFLFWLVGHCDSLDGPVVTLARKALEAGNVNPVLAWVPAKDEQAVRDAFDRAVVVRRLGPAASDLADTHFFETLVRIHRAGEGAPFTGLKPAGLDLGPAIPAADRALADGSVDAVVALVTDAVASGIRRHFDAARRRRNFKPDDVAAGREYVETYVPYIHYVERLYRAATAEAKLHSHAEPEHAAHAD